MPDKPTPCLKMPYQVPSTDCERAHLYIPVSLVRAVQELAGMSSSEAAAQLFELLTGLDRACLMSFSLTTEWDQQGNPWYPPMDPALGHEHFAFNKPTQRGSSAQPNEANTPKADEKDTTTVTSIHIVKLSYQEHPYVIGIRNGEDVWLHQDGSWSTDEESELAVIPLSDGLEIHHKKAKP